ncbi:hypothetical protein CASFOL_020701 [Castilleja foliolosa]|uniref:Uncharacterized protein n=1 Tax=Castilleja foliolosa TaxID=1961234 RepID=A0ABD3D4E1_9LAMI
MDSSKILEGAEECCSSESGWTMYIASPGHEHDDRADDDDVSDDVSVRECTKDDGDVDSDDSMASDASSGPGYQKLNLFGEGKTDEIKCVDKKKYNQHEDKKKNHEQKIEKSRHGENSEGRSKKI